MANLNYGGMKRRDEFLQFMKLGTTGEYSILGVGSEEISLEYSAESNTYRWVTMKNGVTVTMGYELTSGVEQYVHTDDPLFPVIDGWRRKLETSGAVGKILNVAVYMSEDEEPTTCPADEHDISIEFNTFGGSSDSPLQIGYTINYNGDPVEGIATLDYEAKTATFAPKNTPEG